MVIKYIRGRVKIKENKLKISPWQPTTHDVYAQLVNELLIYIAGGEKSRQKIKKEKGDISASQFFFQGYLFIILPSFRLPVHRGHILHIPHNLRP
jgi:hypothetical protein